MSRPQICLAGRACDVHRDDPAWHQPPLPPRTPITAHLQALTEERAA